MPTLSCSPAGGSPGGGETKDFARFGGRTSLERMLAALRGVPSVGRIRVVGPEAALRALPAVAGCEVDRGS